MEYLDSNVEIKRTSPLRAAIWAFAFSFLILLTLFIIQFLLKYDEDIFGKGLELTDIIKLIFYVGLTLIKLIIPVSVLLFSIFYYKEKYRFESYNINTQIRKSILPVMAFSVFMFIWIAYFNPKAELHMNALLYDVRQTSPGAELQKTDINLFRDIPGLCNIHRLGELSDSMEIKINNAKRIIVATIATTVSASQLDSILNTESAQAINLTHDDFKGQKLRTSVDYDENAMKELSLDFVFAKQDLENYNIQFIKMLITKYKMIGFPFLIAFIFYIGMFIGILRRNGRFIPILILAIYFIFYPIMHFLIIYSERLPRAKLLPAGAAQFLLLLIFMFVAFIFYTLAHRNLRNQPSP